MRLVRWLLSFSLAILALTFSILNRQEISLYWSPVHGAIESPLYFIVLSFMAAGFLAGGMIVWINTIPVRRSARQFKKRTQALEKELEALKLPPAQDAPRSYINPAPVNQNSVQPQPAALEYKG